MSFSESFRIAISALKANKLRAFLTMLGIIIGVASVILLVSIGNGLKTYITQQLEDLGADTLFVIPGEFEVSPGGGGSGGTPGAGVAASKFTFDRQKQLEKEGKLLKIVMAYTENNGTLSYQGKTLVTQVSGVGPQFPEVRDQKVAVGSFFTPSQYNSGRKVVVIGKTVAEDLFGEEDPIGKKITISDQKYIVLGVLEEKGSFGSFDIDKQVFVPATTAMRHFDMEKVQSFWIKAVSSQQISEAKAEVESILLKTLDDDEFSILDTKSILVTISRILGVLTAALAGIAAISLLVGGIGIMNIMLVSVTERTREVGLRKAVGAKPKAILIQFLVEAIILCLLGGSLGVLLGILGSLGINRFFTTTVTSWSIVIAFSVSALVGIIFGVFPAAKAARLNPIEALRYE